MTQKKEVQVAEQAEQGAATPEAKALFEPDTANDEIVLWKPQAIVPVEVSRLKPDDVAKAQQLCAQIDALDPQNVLAFGARPQQDLNTVSAEIVDRARTKDAGEAGDTLTDLMKVLREADVDSMIGPLEKVISQIPLVGQMVDQAARILSSYEPMARKIARIEVMLEDHKLRMFTDIANLDKMYDRNLSFIGTLSIYIAAGKLKVQELQDMLAELQKQVGSDDTVGLKIDDVTKAIDRMEQRIYDLELTRMMAIQTAPQIRLVQDGDERLAAKIQTSILITIPLWNQQIALAIALFNQQSAVKAVGAVNDTTNELLQKNASLLHKATVDVRRETERGVIDIETLQKVNQELIGAINDAIKISEEARAKRIEGEKQLAAMEGEIRTVLQNTGAPRQIEAY